MADKTEEFDQDEMENAGDHTGDPAQAFDDLREAVEKLSREMGSELTIIRKGVEAAFEQFDRMGKPIDYSADLGRMVKQLDLIGRNLQAIEQLPVLGLQPSHITKAAETGGEKLAKSFVREFEEVKRDLVREAHDLAGYTKSARDRKAQNINLWLVGLCGLVLGFLLTMVVPRFLPFDMDSRIAAAIMQKDRWNAGYDLMHAYNPSSAEFMGRAKFLVEINTDRIDECQTAAAKEAKEQNCTIKIPVPGK